MENVICTKTATHNNRRVTIQCVAGNISTNIRSIGSRVEDLFLDKLPKIRTAKTSFHKAKGFTREA